MESTPDLASSWSGSSIFSCEHEGSCRTTWSMLFSCVSTIILCIWTALHPNVLYSDFDFCSIDRRSMRWQERLLLSIRQKWKAFTYRLPILILALIYPEYIVFWAVQQRGAARHLAKQSGWTPTHGYFVLMGGFHLFDPHGKPLRPLKLITITDLIGQNVLNLPTQQEIQDRSKSNALLTAVALMQVTWFLVDCIARATLSMTSTQYLPLTKLDIVTISYIAVSLSIYIAWWDKPRNVLDPIRVHQDKAGVIFPGFLEPQTPPSKNVKVVDLLGVVYGAADYVFRLEDSGKVPRFYAGTIYYGYKFTSLFMAILMGVVATGIHCIAWSFGSSLSSFAEIGLWRVFSLAFWLPIVVIVVFLTVLAACQSDLLPWFGQGLCVVMIVLGVFYVVSRVILLVLALLALRSLPSTAYRTVHWVNFIPHI